MFRFRSCSAAEGLVPDPPLRPQLRRHRSLFFPESPSYPLHGLWLLIDGQEYFLPFEAFPWFRNATVAQLSRIERPLAGHLHWLELDIDLSLRSIEHPEDYPLVSGASPGGP